MKEVFKSFLRGAQMFFHILMILCSNKWLKLKYEAFKRRFKNVLLKFDYLWRTEKRKHIVIYIPESGIPGKIDLSVFWLIYWHPLTTKYRDWVMVCGQILPLLVCTCVFHHMWYLSTFGPHMASRSISPCSFFTTSNRCRNQNLEYSISASKEKHKNTDCNNIWKIQ